MKKIVSVIFIALCIFLLSACQTIITTTTSTTSTTTTSVSTVNTTTVNSITSIASITTSITATTTETTSTLPSIIDSLSIEYDSLTTEEEYRQFNLDFEAILQTLHQDGFIFPSNKPIYVQFSLYQFNKLIDNSLNLNKKSVKSMSALENIFFAMYGNFANYGIVYGLSRYYAGKLGIQTETLPTLSIRDDINDINQHLLELWYVGFIEPYSTQDESLLSKQLSVQFVNYLIDNHGFEYIQSLLSKTSDLVEFDLAFTEIRNQWLTLSGSIIRVEPRQVPLAFGYELHWYKAIWKSPRAIWFLHRDYEDFAAQYTDHADYFTSTLDNLVTIITTLEHQMAEMDNIFKNTNLNPKLQYPDLLIYLGERSYFSRNVFVNMLYAFIHEYVHYLTVYWIEPYKWLIEGIPLYYTRTYGYEGEVMRKANTSEIDPTIAAFEEYLGREFVFDNDWLDWIDYKIYTSDNYDKTVGTHPIQGISFVRYFIKVYGEETFFMFARNISKSYELTGRTYEQLVEDWIQDVKNRFSSN
jgi:hypothetical protein